MADELSRMHFKAVQAEITGRFFSAYEAAVLKEQLDLHTVTDPKIRIAAAEAWHDKDWEQRDKTVTP